MTTVKEIEKILRQHFCVESIRIDDESALHKGHAQAQKQGGGHFTLYIVSNDFNGKSQLERHQMINRSLKDQFKDAIHALKIKAVSPREL